MSLLITVLVYALVLGLISYLISMLPVDGRIKQIAYIILIIIGIVLLLNLIGAIDPAIWRARPL